MRGFALASRADEHITFWTVRSINIFSIPTAWSSSATLRCMGRPAGFDQTETLETIQSIFWNNGYSATSLDDIMQGTVSAKAASTAPTAQSKEMYVLAFTIIRDWAVADLRNACGGNDADAIVRLRAYIQSAAKGGANARRGCMLAKGTAEVAARFPDVDKIIERTFKAMEREIVHCVRQAQSAATLPPIAMRERSAQRCWPSFAEWGRWRKRACPRLPFRWLPRARAWGCCSCRYLVLLSRRLAKSEPTSTRPPKRTCLSGKSACGKV